MGSGDKEVFLARIFTGKKSVKTSWKILAREKAKGVSINSKGLKHGVSVGGVAQNCS